MNEQIVVQDSSLPSDSSLPIRAYVISQFPEFCETFVQNEIMQLANQGIPFVVFSLKHCRDQQFQPGARELMEKSTIYPPFLLSPASLMAHIQILFTNPMAWFSCLALALSTGRHSLSVCLKTLYVFLQAPYFARQTAKRRIAHIHAHWASIPSSAGLFIARMSGVSFSFTAHAYDIFINQILLDKKIEAARYVVTCTQYNCEFMTGLYPEIPPEKIRAIYHGVDLSAFNEPHDSALEEPLILSVGRLCDTKGFPDLIAACAILRDKGIDLRCEIAGDGYMRRELEEQIRTLKLVNHVSILGLLPRDQLIAKYKRARLFVLPCVTTSRGDQDGLPNVIVEAMAMGLPIVTTQVSALSEGVSHGETGLLVNPYSPHELANAIDSLWENPALRKQMGENGRARAAELFGLQDNIKKLAAFIKEQHNA